jgi:hypothetical protein
MAAIDDLLGKRLGDVENPDWYLSVFAQALEETGDARRAAAVADALIEEHPHPSEDEFTRVMRLVAGGGEKFAPRVKPSPFAQRHKSFRIQ